MHQIALARLHILQADQMSEHTMLTANMLHHVFCEDLSPETRLQHVEPRQRDGEAEQLYLVVSIFERLRPHRRQPEVVGSLYQASHSVEFIAV